MAHIEIETENDWRSKGLKFHELVVDPKKCIKSQERRQTKSIIFIGMVWYGADGKVNILRNN